MQKSHPEAVMEHHMETGWLMIVDHDFLLLENSQKLNHTILDSKKIFKKKIRLKNEI